MTKKNQHIGLTDLEVRHNRDLYGDNVLTPPAQTPLWYRFAAKFKDPLIVILLVAGVLSVGISFYEYFGLHEGVEVFFEPVGIFIAILLATGLAFIFEYKAEKEFNMLNQVNDEEPVKVIRNGRVCEIPKRDVVVGDIAILNTGDEVPADGQLLESVALLIDESTLTGEPIAEKHVHEKGEAEKEETTYPVDMVLRGTKVMEGHAVFRVQHVGDSTECGKVFTAAQIDDHVKTPLHEQLNWLGKMISRASYGIAGVIIIARLLVYVLTNDAIRGNLSVVFQDQHVLLAFVLYVLQTVMIAVTLIVVAVPEGLPMAVTLSLAYSMRRMLKTNNLVRTLHACETMGATTVICTDKTGTLTKNQMQVSEVYAPKESKLLYYNMSVNSTALLNDDQVIGNPTEGALLLWLKGQGVDYQIFRNEVEVIGEVPFSTERKYMSTTILTPASAKAEGMPNELILLKGAPEIIMGMCQLTEEERQVYQQRLADYQSHAMRTLAFACNGVMQGIVAISDPVRSDVPAAVRECLDAGINVKIVTGDTPLTAMEIARQVGLGTSYITGAEMEMLSDDALRQRVQEIDIVARARPMDKKRLVEALQANGDVVSVTGDGTNDAPALKAAHVGLSMGNGTSVAKEASDITIIDNSFSSISTAVMWGRSLYQNIQRFILFQTTVNVVACLVVLVGACFDTQSPLTVTQMLWVNLIMDTFAAMALASLPPNKLVMKDKPRNRHDFIISKPMWKFISSVGLLFAGILMGVYFWFERTGSFTPYELSLFFTIFVMLQFWNLFNAKAFMTGKSAWANIRQSKEFLFIVMLIFFGQILIVQFGDKMFNVVPLSWRDWLTIIGITSFVLWIGELIQLLKRHGFTESTN